VLHSLRSSRPAIAMLLLLLFCCVTMSMNTLWSLVCRVTQEKLLTVRKAFVVTLAILAVVVFRWVRPLLSYFH